MSFKSWMRHEKIEQKSRKFFQTYDSSIETLVISFKTLT